MVNCPNKWFSGWCSNEGNKQSNIIRYIISTVRDISDLNGGSIAEEINSLEEFYNLDDLGLDEPYYCVYGSFKFDIPRGPIKIFETDSLRSAIFIVEQLTGNKVVENEIQY